MESIKELNIVRIINAPRELVFKAWIEPKRLAAWWMPKGFTIPVCEIDARLGGKMRMLAEHKDFPNHWMTGVILELVEPELLVFTSQAFADDNGNAKLEVRNTIKFEEEGGKTKLTLHAVVEKAAPEMSFALAGMDEGWKQTLDKLDAYIQGNIDKNKKQRMKKTKIIYWIFTILFVLSMLSTAIPELIGSSNGEKFMGSIGYPMSINAFLGIAKLLGIIAILIPGWPRLKEWAYAGFTFDLLGATYAMISAGLPVSNCAFMAIFFILLIGSYLFYHKKLKATS